MATCFRTVTQGGILDLSPLVALHGNWENINLENFHGVLKIWHTCDLYPFKVTTKDTRGTFIHVVLVSLLFTLNSCFMTSICSSVVKLIKLQMN